MSEWDLISYNGKDIKTLEDIIWVCEEVEKTYKWGDVELKDQMALSFLKKLHQKHIDEGRFGFINSRFEILDL